MRRSLALVLLALSGEPALSWEGTDQSGNSVVIEGGNLVRSGEDIEVFNYGAGRYENYTVEGIHRAGGLVELEVYNHDTGEHTTLEMDDG